MPSFSAQLVERAPLSPRVVGMSFLASQPFARAAGQYVALTLDEGTTHAFSIATPFTEREPERFEIAVARGTTAAALLELPLGASVAATGPSGSLVWKGDAPALLVATGTGLSPLRAMVLEQLASSAREPLVLLFGCRDASEELWGAELGALQRQHARFRFLPTHSQPALGHAGRVGRVQRYLPEVVRELGLGLRAYLCGHTPMVNDCTLQLLELGIAPERVHGESY
jgi:CDP-4-dehydro-6-deoxyglucose reductase